MNVICNFLYCNHKVHRDFLMILYKRRGIPRIFSRLSAYQYILCTTAEILPILLMMGSGPKHVE
jgi:hypothetical protein